jgi:predicted secreted Zn-dependent protease
MIISLTSLMAALAVQAAAPEPGPPSARLVEAVGRVGLSDLPDLALVGYEVEGRSPRSVRDSIDRRRPADPSDGVRHDARTRWNYRTQWRNGPDGRCLPATATVTLSITMILPDLASREQLSAREQAGWDAYFTALIAHERNHGRIAAAGREQMQAAMRTSPDCDAMTAVIRTTNAEVADASREYDRQTDHGRTEGAVYPRPGS